MRQQGEGEQGKSKLPWGGTAMGYQDGTLLPAWLVSPGFGVCCRAVSITSII